jgi:hypothetical protein
MLAIGNKLLSTFVCMVFLLALTNMHAQKKD